jgi:hypothetical protein
MAKFYKLLTSENYSCSDINYSDRASKECFQKKVTYLASGADVISIFTAVIYTKVYQAADHVHVCHESLQ